MNIIIWLRRRLRLFWLRNSFLIICAFLVIAFSVYHRLDSINFWGLPRHIPCDSSPYTNNPNRFTGIVNNQADVPDILHFVRFGRETTCFTKNQAHCLVAAWKNHRPKKIYVHTDRVNAVRNVISNILVREKAVLQSIDVKYYPRPKHIFGLEFDEKYRSEQEADFTKLKILRRYGGIYIKNNVYLLRNLKQFLHFEMTVLVRPTGDVRMPIELSEDVVIAHKDARFLDGWLQTYHQYEHSSGRHIKSPVMKSLLKNNTKYVRILENHAAVEEVNDVNEEVQSMSDSQNSYFVMVKNDDFEHDCDVLL